MSYPEDTQPWHLCHMEGCIGRGNCPRCGRINYHLLGYYGAVARWSKQWELTEAETEARFAQHEEERQHQAACCEEWWEHGACTHSTGVLP